MAIYQEKEMTLEQKKIKDIIQNLLNACRQGECDLEELQLDADDVSQIRGICPLCMNGVAACKENCTRCNGKGVS